MIDFDDLVLGPCMEHFGQTVTFTPAVGDEVEVTAIFTDSYTHVLEGPDGLSVVSTNPTLGCRAADFDAEPARDDTFTVSGTEYRVVETNPDSLGHLLIQLMKAA
jgi:hypothetical protein